MARRLRPGELLPDSLGLQYQVPGWQRAIDAGEVADSPDTAHPVETWAHGNRTPAYVTLAFTEDRLRSKTRMHADPAASLAELMAQLRAGETVNGWTATYRLVQP
ncbi:MAG: hypothetical protein IT352_15475 [Gemmatimonadales bacterium]|nr:hypothetical protein [Gemmatimonadales bacterium]